MDVSAVTLGSVPWKKGDTLFDGSSADYNYTKVTELGTKDFAVTYASPESVAVNDKMTLLQANATLANMAAR